MLDIIKLNTCIVTYKTYSGKLNSRLTKLFIINKPSTRQGNILNVQFKRPKLKSFRILRCSVTLWNSLDSTELNSVILFKKCHKCVLVKAYNEE